MISKVRHFTSGLFPDKINQYLAIQLFPEIVNFTGKMFQGIDNVWDMDVDFNKIYKRLYSRILLDKKRAFLVYQISKNCKVLNGHYAELGVYRGATSRIMFEASDKKKNIYCFDTFEGIPDTNKDKDNYWVKRDLKVDYDEVKNFLYENNFKLFKGLFPQTASELNMTFSFVHIDTDIYKSTKDGCKFFYDKMVKSGIILIDDYSMLSTIGVKKAVDEFFDDKKEAPLPLFTGQSLICKQ